MPRSISFYLTFGLFCVLTLGFTSLAQTSPVEDSEVGIENFGQMDERFYRGAQPTVADLKYLKEIGIDTIVNLRNDPQDFEKAAVEELGMRYVHIPMSGWKTPKEHQIKSFLELVDDPETGKFFVHCKAGIHRTGVVGAVYRFEHYDWDYKKAYREMKNYDFSWWLVHGRLKSYVKRYAREYEKQKALEAGVAIDN